MIRALFLTLLLAASAGAQAPSAPSDASQRDVAFDQRLNEQVPLDAEFKDEFGKTVPLSNFFDGKPVVLILVWYKCPGICPIELTELANRFREADFILGKDYHAIAVSIAQEETPELARTVKDEYLQLYGMPGGGAGWHFLTGKRKDIDRLAASIGYKYKYDRITHQYAHPAGITILTPDGKISRYLFGLTYPAKDLRLGLIDASDRKIGSPVEVLLLSCGIYDYNHKSGRYMQNVVRILQIAGMATVLIVFGSVGYMGMKYRRRAIKPISPKDLNAGGDG